MLIRYKCLCIVLKYCWKQIQWRKSVTFSYFLSDIISGSYIVLDSDVFLNMVYPNQYFLKKNKIDKNNMKCFISLHNFIIFRKSFFILNVRKWIHRFSLECFHKCQTFILPLYSNINFILYYKLGTSVTWLNKLIRKTVQSIH